jgi:hypothetical protein
MAIFKPKTTSNAPSTGGGNKFLGTIEVGLVGFTDKSKEFDWADIFIDIELSVKDSEFTNRMSLLGKLDKDANGDINGGSVLKRMYNLFEMIGCNAGLNIKGEWEDEHGNNIKDIGEYLTQRYTTTTQKYVAYAYKKKPNKPGKKVYTEVYPKLYLNNADGKAKCEETSAWLKEKGVIKVADATDMPQQGDVPLADSALSNL